MRNKKISFNFKRRRIKLEVLECNSLLEKTIGLMFRGENTPALLFNFKKTGNWTIHSLFCPEFFAVWLDDKNKAVEIQRVKPWKFNITTEREFVRLIEIPVNERYRGILQLLDEN